jgi:hypothetical protein
MSTTVRATRKCSQCHQEGCNKGKATCPINVEKNRVPVVVEPAVVPAKKLCEGCQREGCCYTSLSCPIRVELLRHVGLAKRYEIPPQCIIEVEHMFSHIQDPEHKRKLSFKLYNKIIEIYNYQLYLHTIRLIQERNTNAARGMAAHSNQRSKVKLNVLPEYKMCSEECGICYHKTCNVTLNCNHQVCVDCFKAHVTSTETKINASLKCPFCRCVTETVNATDNTVYDELLKV